MEERATLAKQEVALVFPTKSAAAVMGSTENPPGEKNDAEDERPQKWYRQNQGT